MVHELKKGVGITKVLVGSSTRESLSRMIPFLNDISAFPSDLKSLPGLLPISLGKVRFVNKRAGAPQASRGIRFCCNTAIEKQFVAHVVGVIRQQ